MLSQTNRRLAAVPPISIMMLILAKKKKKKEQNEWHDSEYIFIHTSVFKIYNDGPWHPRKPDYHMFSNRRFKDISALTTLCW